MALDRGGGGDAYFLNILHYLIPLTFTSETINKNNSVLCPNFSFVLAIKMLVLSCIALRDSV